MPLALPVVEGFTLPRISANLSSGSTFVAYVTAFVTDPEKRMMADGSFRYPLWYLSMIAPRGQAVALEAIASTLFTNSTIRDVSIEKLGQVALGHKRADLVRQTYGTPHWTYQQARDGDSLHAEVFSPAMSDLTPPEERETRRKKPHRPARGKVARSARAEGGTTISTRQSESAAPTGSAQTRDPARYPLLLATTPPGETSEAALAESFRALLATRVPFPIAPEWRDVVWQSVPRDECRVWAWGEDVLAPFGRAAVARPDVQAVLRAVQQHIREPIREVAYA